jgi:hypothetical protein
MDPCGIWPADAWERYSRACALHQERIADMEATYR